MSKEIKDVMCLRVKQLVRILITLLHILHTSPSKWNFDYFGTQDLQQPSISHKIHPSPSV